MTQAPEPQGSLGLLARPEVLSGQGARANDPLAWLNRDAQNPFPGQDGIFMSQRRMALLRSVSSAPAPYRSVVATQFLTLSGQEGNGVEAQNIDALPALRVSGDFNVFAAQILCTDNIDVQGVSTGLPVPPAASPTSLNVDDAAAKGACTLGALNESLQEVQQNSAIKAPSIIEVKVLGQGEEYAQDRTDCEPSGAAQRNQDE